MADQMQIYKYVHPPGRARYGKTDLHAEAGLRRQRLGMHVHQSIWKDGKPVFAGNKYADLSRNACSSAAASSTPRR